VCRAMIQQFEGGMDSKVAERILYTCVLEPDALNDPNQLMSLAELTIPVWQGNYRLLGAAAYRNGEYEAAIRHFEAAAEVAGRRSWDWSFLAMAYERSGQHSDAQDALNKATAWAANDGPADKWGWTEQVASQQLLQEARLLLAAE